MGRESWDVVRRRSDAFGPRRTPGGTGRAPRRRPRVRVGERRGVRVDEGGALLGVGEDLDARAAGPVAATQVSTGFSSSPSGSSTCRYVVSHASTSQPRRGEVAQVGRGLPHRRQVERRARARRRARGARRSRASAGGSGRRSCPAPAGRTSRRRPGPRPRRRAGRGGPAPTAGSSWSRRRRAPGRARPGPTRAGRTAPTRPAPRGRARGPTRASPRRSRPRRPGRSATAWPGSASAGPCPQPRSTTSCGVVGAHLCHEVGERPAALAREPGRMPWGPSSRARACRPPDRSLSRRQET